jgi:hypothetical protein
MPKDPKKSLKIWAAVFDWLCLAVSLTLIAMTLYLAQQLSPASTSGVSSSGAIASSVASSESSSGSSSSILDSATPIVLQLLVFLFLGIASLFKRKSLTVFILVFAFTTTTACSFMNDFKDLLALPSAYATNWAQGLYNTGLTVGDLVLAAATIFFCVSVLQEDGRKTARITLTLILCSIPFYAISLTLVCLTLAADQVIFSYIGLIALLQFSLQPLVSLCYFFNVDGYYYSGRFFAHEKQ